jgi:hypothetical protein
MIRSSYGQAACENCGGWHYALRLDENGGITEVTCCRCKLITPIRKKEAT